MNTSRNGSREDRQAALVAIVGCGKIAVHHARHLAACPSAKLCALVDSNRAAAVALAERFGVPHVFSSLEEAFDKVRLDAVHITTPPDTHEPLAKMLLERGVHVLVEKPVTYSLQAARDLCRVADEKGVMLVPDYSLFYHAGMVQAREWVRSGRIGRLVGVDCLYQSELDRARLQEPKSPPWLFTLPGGVLQNFYSHPLYLTLEFTGPVKRLQVMNRSLGSLPQGLTDSMDLVIDGERCVARINVSLAARPAQIILVLHGEKGRITVEFDAFQVRLDREVGRLRSVWRMIGPAIRGAKAIEQTARNAMAVLTKRLVPYLGLKALIDRFYAAVLAKGANPIPRDLLIEVTKAEEEILHSDGKWRLTYPHAAAVTLTTAPRTIAVTGGAGYLGQQVVTRLLQEGYSVRALVRWQSRTESLVRPGVQLFYGDARDLDAVRRLVRGVEGVAHMAAGIKGSREFILESCVEATRNVLQAVREAGVARNIYISSMAVYDYLGQRRRDWLKEDSPLEAVPQERSAYAQAKRLAEALVTEPSPSQASSWLVLRPSGIFGGERKLPDQLGTRLGRRLVLLGGPKKKLRLIHVDDVAAAIVFFLAPAHFRPGLVLNLTHPDELLAKDAVALIRQRGVLKPIYLWRFAGLSLAACTRVSRALLGRGPRMSKRQAAYIFSECGADASASIELGWRPGSPLLEQLAKSL